LRFRYSLQRSLFAVAMRFRATTETVRVGRVIGSTVVASRPFGVNMPRKSAMVPLSLSRCSRSPTNAAWIIERCFAVIVGRVYHLMERFTPMDDRR